MTYDALAGQTPDRAVVILQRADLPFQGHSLPDSSQAVAPVQSAISPGVNKRSSAAADKSGGMGAPDNGKPKIAPEATQRPVAMEATPAVPNAQIAGLTI